MKPHRVTHYSTGTNGTAYWPGYYVVRILFTKKEAE